MRTQLLFDFNSYRSGISEFDTTSLTTSSSSDVNVSNIDKLNTGQSLGFKGFHLARNYKGFPATLNGEYYLYGDEGYPGAVFAQLTDAEGYSAQFFEIPLNTTANVIAKTHLCINFDVMSGEYATWLYIASDGSDQAEVKLEIKVDKPTYRHIISLEPFKNTNTSKPLFVQIVQWNKPYACVKVTRLSPIVQLRYTDTDVKSFTCSENFLDTQLHVSTGICEQYADIELIDRDDVLRKLTYVESFLLDDCTVIIQAIDDNSATTYTLGSYIVSSWDLNDNKMLCKCTDKSNAFDNIYLTTTGMSDRTLYEMFDEFFKTTGFAWRPWNSETEDALKKNKTPNVILDSSTATVRLQKLCAQGCARVYSVNNVFIVRCLVA